MPAAPRGRLVVVSGPSGAGKTTVLRAGPAAVPAAAGAQRFGHHPAPAAGRDRRRRLPLPHRRGVRTPAGNRGSSSNVSRFSAAATGTGRFRSEVTAGLEAGKWVVLDIDVQGALAVMDRYRGRDHHFRPAQLARGTPPPPARPGHRDRRGHPAAARAGPATNWAWPTATVTRSINDDVDQAVEEICDILTRPMGDRPECLTNCGKKRS